MRRKSERGRSYANDYYLHLVNDRPEYLLWQSSKKRAKKQGLEFLITPEDVKGVWPSDNMCPALGIELRRSRKGTGGYEDCSPSLDRLRPQFGYVRGNIAVISMKANRLKQDQIVPDDLRKVADWIEQVANGGWLRVG